MKKIAVITRDCAGINAAIRSVVRTAHQYRIEVVGGLREYDGLIDADFVPLDRGAVSGLINMGGTILKTARSERFYTQTGQQQAVDNLRKHHVDGLIVIGGNGSLRGAHVLASQYHFPVVAIPATIDNDVNGIDFSIGADTAVNVAVEALDKIRDTATSLERIFVVEVMGRKSGFIALQVALAGGCEEVLLPEHDTNIDVMCNEIQQGNSKGKKSWIIIVAEGKRKAQDVAGAINERTGLETRVAVLGHIQRGGRPTAQDRILATRFGNYAVDVLRSGQTDVCVGLKEGKLVTIPLQVAIEPKTLEVTEGYRLLKVVT